MLNSIFTGLSGLLAFSKGLDVLSNNIANMNTPGFKGSELAFRDMFYRLMGGNQGDAQMGQGVDTGSSYLKHRQGELRETGNALDVGIDGNGFFVLRRDGDTFFSRAGQFDFDSQGFLIERSSGARVAGLSGGKQLIDINILDRRTSAPKPTSEISFTGNLSTGGSTHKITDVTVFDAFGTKRTLTINFTSNNSNTPRSWLIEVRDENDAVIANGEIRYQGNGSPETGFNTVQFDYTPAGVTTGKVMLDFGEPNSFSGSTGFSGGTTSDLQVRTQDGLPVGSVTESSFNEKGELTVKYSNGHTSTFDRLAIARFHNLQNLKPVGGSLFENTSSDDMVLGSADIDGMGRTLAKRVELSNVELTEQFTDMVIIQRGYQASSQVISVTNEMMQQLMDIRGRR